VIWSGFDLLDSLQDVCCSVDNEILDLQKGAKWLLKGVNSTSLRVLLAPLGRCWIVYDFLGALSDQRLDPPMVSGELNLYDAVVFLILKIASFES